MALRFILAGAFLATGIGLTLWSRTFAGNIGFLAVGDLVAVFLLNTMRNAK